MGRRDDAPAGRAHYPDRMEALAKSQLLRFVEQAMHVAGRAVTRYSFRELVVASFTHDIDKHSER